MNSFGIFSRGWIVTITMVLITAAVPTIPAAAAWAEAPHMTEPTASEPAQPESRTKRLLGEILGFFAGLFGGVAAGSVLGDAGALVGGQRTFVPTLVTMWAGTCFGTGFGAKLGGGPARIGSAFAAGTLGWALTTTAFVTLGPAAFAGGNDLAAVTVMSSMLLPPNFTILGTELLPTRAERRKKRRARPTSISVAPHQDGLRIVVGGTY